VRELLDKIEARQLLVRETVERLREQIAELTGQLAAAELTLKRLETTRETVLELATEDGTPPPEPLAPGYREILALFEQNRDGLRAKDVCRTPGTGTEPRHTEGMRAKLKRLVNRGILTEAEPGLFTLTPPPPATPETDSSGNRTRTRRTPSQRSFSSCLMGYRRFSTVRQTDAGEAAGLVVAAETNGVTPGAEGTLRLSHSRTPGSVPCFDTAARTPGRTPPRGGISRSWLTVARTRVICPMPAGS